MQSKGRLNFYKTIVRTPHHRSFLLSESPCDLAWSLESWPHFQDAIVFLLLIITHKSQSDVVNSTSKIISKVTSISEILYSSLIPHHFVVYISCCLSYYSSHRIIDAWTDCRRCWTLHNAVNNILIVLVVQSII